MLKALITAMLFAILWVLPVSAEQVSSVVMLFNDETAEHIEKLLDSRDAMAVTMIAVPRLLSHEEINHLYKQRSFQPLWLDGWQLKPAAIFLMDHLRNAGAHGLCGNAYLLAELEGLIRIQRDFARHNLPLAPDNRAVLDLFLSQAFLTYATHLVEGQVDPALVHVDWRARRRKVDLVKLLEYALDKNRITQVMEGLMPPHPEYQNLMAVLAHYQQIAATGGWPTIPAGPAIRPDYRDERVTLLKELLQKTGDLVDIANESNLYDETTVAAVKMFQIRHGLIDDGVVGSKTLEVMNISVDQRIQQVELNLERWRWMPKSFGKRHIRVNIADFSLKVIEGDATVMQMPVIVGTQYRKTPVFSANMSYLEFAPYWTVPPTILREDKLPLIKQNPDYLAEKHFRILSRQQEDVYIDPLGVDWSAVEAETFPGLLRMEPGPENPLGRVKFMFPNKFNVYLHDTNESYLFDNNVRSFSSGCIRVERPRDLAYYLLKDELDIDMLDELLMLTEPEQVSIEPIPVHIQYWTAWVDEEKLVHFRPDVYFRDLDLEVALNDPAYRVMDQLHVSNGSRLARLN